MKFWGWRKVKYIILENLKLFNSLINATHDVN